MPARKRKKHPLPPVVCVGMSINLNYVNSDPAEMNRQYEEFRHLAQDTVQRYKTP